MNRAILVVLLITSFIFIKWQPASTQNPAAATPQSAIPSSSQPDSRLGLDGPVHAEDVFKNIEIFKGKPATQVLPAMNAIGGNLGVSCIHCHTQFEWDRNDKPAKETTRKMFRMMGYIEEKYFDHKNKVTCWTCHRGHAEQPQPSAKPPEEAEQYIHLSTEDAHKPAEEVFHNIQMFKSMPAGKVPVIMNFFSSALGVKCSHCHVQDQWEKDDVEAKKTARKMLSMVTDVIHQFYGKNGSISCSGCHQGKVKPENGLEVSVQGAQ